MSIRRCMLAAGLAVAVAGCGVGQGGPLSHDEPQGAGHDTQSIGAPCGAVVVDGFNSLPDSSHEVAVIDRVALYKPIGMRMITAWIVPDNGSLYGDWVGYPPAGDHHPAEPGFDWANRQHALGAHIPPTPFGGTPSAPRANVQLLVVIKTSGRTRSTEQGIDVWYHVDRRHYHLRTDVALIAHVEGSCQQRDRAAP
jgi:hypothetical protein